MTLVLLLFLPTIHGCGSTTGAAGDAVPFVTTVVDHTSIRCPRVDDRQRAILRRRVKPPQPDKPDGVSRAALFAKIDELRRDADLKGRTGIDIADQSDRCIGGTSAKTETSS